MNLVVDTSVLIDHLRGHPPAVELLKRSVADGHELWSISVVRTEVLIGLRRGEEAATHRLLDQLAWLDVDVALCDRAAALGRPYLRSHPGIDVVDFVLAAAVQELGGRLLTSNVRHFPMLPDLEAAY